MWCGQTVRIGISHCSFVQYVVQISLIEKFISKLIGQSNSAHATEGEGGLLKSVRKNAQVRRELAKTVTSHKSERTP